MRRLLDGFQPDTVGLSFGPALSLRYEYVNLHDKSAQRNSAPSRFVFEDWAPETNSIFDWKRCPHWDMLQS
jgi:hypothetical protein